MRRYNHRMAPDYHHIAYVGLDIANPVTLGSVLSLAGRSGLSNGVKVLDVGAGTGGVATALARRFGYQVHAIERDPVMVDHIRRRVRHEGLEDRVNPVQGTAPGILDLLAPADMIVALGSTRIGGPEATTADEVFRLLAARLSANGCILWGDLTWIEEPPQPLRQVVDLAGVYASDEGWRSAARNAGMECIAGEMSEQAVFDDFFSQADRRVRDWLDAHPDAEGADTLRLRADQVRAMIEFGRPYLGFGLYLFRRA